MSLMVYILPKNNTLDISNIEKEIQPQYNFLFGVENWRKSFWGSDKIKDIGCKLLHTLKDTDIYAFDDDIEVMKNDLNLVLKNITELANGSDAYREQVEFRVKDALEAVRVAQMHSDKVGVYIG